MHMHGNLYRKRQHSSADFRKTSRTARWPARLWRKQSLRRVQQLQSGLSLCSVQVIFSWKLQRKRRSVLWNVKRISTAMNVLM